MYLKLSNLGVGLFPLLLFKNMILKIINKITYNTKTYFKKGILFMSKVVKLVEEIAIPIIEELNLIYVDCDLKKTHGNLTLTIYIDKENGVTLQDCELVSKALDEPLENVDVSRGEPYNLNVSSPGLDRPLTKKVDFKRNLNKEIEVKFYSPFTNGKKVIAGTLISYNTESFTILSDDNEITINKNLVALATPIIKF